MKKIILASASHARAELLKKIVPQFEISVSATAEIDERSGLSYEAIAMTNAKIKASEVFKNYSAMGIDCIVIGADTVVVTPDNSRLLHKPKDIAEAKSHLKTLAGKTHRVITGIYVVNKHKNSIEAVTSKVTLAPISEQEIDSYVKDGHTLDKSGGFSITELIEQGFIINIEGSLDNIIGLPTERLRAVLVGF